MLSEEILKNQHQSAKGIEMTLIFIMTDEADSFAAKMGRSDALQSAISVFDKNESCNWCRPFFCLRSGLFQIHEENKVGLQILDSTVSGGKTMTEFAMPG